MLDGYWVLRSRFHFLKYDPDSKIWRRPIDPKNFTSLTLAWLRANFKELSSTAIEHEVMCPLKILASIGGFPSCRYLQLGISSVGHIVPCALPSNKS
ncbi:hypothetical protein GOBAR_DD12235 [Gossypium barbadense]|nr:hypothetical protein GOBAR_DD12235 [Gossypium barbadense]